MSASPVINALRNKRAELSGEVLVAQARIEKLRADIAALDSVIVLFDPEAVPKSIRAIVRRERAPRFANGTWTASILRTLREATEPLTTRAIASVLAQQFNLPYERSVDRISLDNRVRTVLKKRRQGIVEDWNGSASTWRVED